MVPLLTINIVRIMNIVLDMIQEETFTPAGKCDDDHSKFTGHWKSSNQEDS